MRYLNGMLAFSVPVALFLQRKIKHKKIFYANSKHNFARYFLVSLARHWAQKETKQKDVVLHTKACKKNYPAHIVIIYVSQCRYLIRDLSSLETAIITKSYDVSG